MSLKRGKGTRFSFFFLLVLSQTPFNINTSEEEDNYLIFTPQYEMYHPDPYDEYPISDGTIKVVYFHDRTKYVRLLYQDFVIGADSEKLESFSKNATITGGLTRGTNPLSSVSEGSDYIKNHIDEMVSKAIEVIPEARATNCVYVDLSGQEDMRWKRVWGSQQDSQWTMVRGL